MNQKNLLFIFADQWRGSAIGYAHEDPVETPNMDAFCEESVYCDHVFSTFPLCSPHRASLLTGKYPLSLGFFTNCKTGLSMRLGDEETGIGEVLKQSGYQTAYIGKWHLDEPEINYDENPVSGAKAWDAFTPPGIRRHGFEYWYSYGTWDEHLHPHYWKNDPEMISVHQWSVEHETEKAMEYLREAKQTDSPFALYLSWNPPHSPYDQVPEKYYDIYKDKKLPLRANVCPDQIHHHTGEVVPYGEAGLLEATREYYAAVSGLDDQFGRLLCFLKEEGLYEDTVIVLSSDHGDMMGSHGLMGKHVWYEESIRIPCIFRIPGIEGKVCSTCMASQDMMPTVLGLLGIPVPGEVEGEDCSLYLTEAQEDPDRVSFICAAPGSAGLIKKFRGHGLNPAHYGWRGIRTQDYTYVMELGYDIPAVKQRHLYHTKADRFQMHPLDVTDPANQGLAAELERLTLEWMAGQKDGFLENWESIV